MNLHQIRELEAALAWLEAHPTYDQLPVAASYLSAPLWRNRIAQGKDIRIPYDYDNDMEQTGDALWAVTRDAGNTRIYYDREGLPPTEVYDDDLLDAYAAALDHDLAVCNQLEQHEVDKVLFMLRTRLLRERDLDPATLPKAKKPPKARQVKPKPPTDGWKAVQKLTLNHQLSYPINLRTCAYVMSPGALVAGESSLTFVNGNMGKRPGFLYHVKSGDIIDFAGPNALMHSYLDLWSAPRQHTHTVTMEVQRLFDALLFVTAMGDYGQVVLDQQGWRIVVDSELHGSAAEQLGGVFSTEWSGLFNLKELVPVLQMAEHPNMDVTCHFNTDGTWRIVTDYIDCVAEPLLMEDLPDAI